MRRLQANDRSWDEAADEHRIPVARHFVSVGQGLAPCGRLLNSPEGLLHT